MNAFQNFQFFLKRFKTSSVLNILGLSVAFATGIIIMIQVDYDLNFDKCHENSDRIYRVERVFDNARSANLQRPFAEMLSELSPHIVAGAVCEPVAYESYVMIGENGSPPGYMETWRNISPSFTKVFKFNMVEGSETALEEPGKILIPQSIARKFFGNEPALGKTIGGGFFTIGGVYKDFPANTIFGNPIYRIVSYNYCFA